MDANTAIAKSLSSSQALMKRYVSDLKPDEYLHRPAAKANCTAWLLGHLILSERNALTRFGVKDLPALPEGFEKQFARDETAPFAGAFGDVSTLLPLWEKHRELLVETVKRTPPQKLDEPLEKPHPLFSNLGELAGFMALHATMHAGQITIIRRSLGRPPLV